MITTYSDGGARGNPGPAAIGIVVYKNNEMVERYKESIGKTTNNQAEYRAVIKALELASKYGKEVKCYLDSQLVVRQLTGQYKIKDKELKKLYSKLKKVEQGLKVEYKHVRRKKKGMEEADRLVNEALDGD